MTPVIKIENLVKRYGDLIALDHLNLEVMPGEIFGLLGPNGSGKTTAINTILSLLSFDKGEVQVFGRQMRPDSYDIKRRIGLVMQDVAVFDELTVEQNIAYFCGLYERDRQKAAGLVQSAIDLAGLQDFRRFYPKKLSGGLKRRLNIACGIAHKPELIFMDEPTVAVDPQARNSILEGIVRLNREGATIIYTSHYMEEVEQICTRIAIMDRGRVIALGTKEELKAMINLGETISVQLLERADEALEEGLRGLPGILSVKAEGGNLEIKTQRGHAGLAAVMNYLDGQKLGYGSIFSQQPTLNDVFLEITGKHLRDGAAG